MQSFSHMKFGVHFFSMVGGLLQMGALLRDAHAGNRLETGRSYRERSWQTEGEDEPSESMFKIIGPIKTTAETACQAGGSVSMRATVKIPPRSLQETKPPEVAIMKNQPVKKMRVFFDDTVES